MLLAFLPTAPPSVCPLLVAVHLARMAVANATRPLMRSGEEQRQEAGLRKPFGSSCCAPRVHVFFTDAAWAAARRSRLYACNALPLQRSPLPVQSSWTGCPATCGAA